ncbi:MULTISPECIES: WxL domain-containing protein [Carnobacterium]|uniref:WxL domain-containing protein n=1 Tax=Carnobacterium TaxID=2747 RepID=UPI001071A176|nr:MULTISPECIES: WxL domain-containing protein [Carnobacterium]MDT1940702.1 WxL domain-containing protein [Carnobacterium divergens]MDT1943140.1 WxL domain-containing protein [Carnobacterium divergens]MDT1948947.1 WxL domain-containing protein [Carnobacterium divergens]MDT1951428.1 WxL domain-containing protein [Carnobacterium divergens]MDT1956605.1 WxL domain-containing protein [Carnobacterium divergens]
MKKITLSLVGVFLFSSVFLGTTASAVEEVGKPVKSNGYVNFDYDDEDATLGTLRINKVSKINFGTTPTKGDTVTINSIYSADDEKDGEFLPLNVQTVDNRGNSAGWQLQIQQTRQFTQLDESNVPITDANKENGTLLDGAELTLTATKATDLSAEKEANRIAPSIFKKVTLSTAKDAGFVTVASAKENEGIGSWNTLFGETSDTVANNNSAVTLKIPGEIKKNKDVSYEAELTWTIVATPEI